MGRERTNVTDLIAGLLLTALAGGYAYVGWGYGLGTFGRMGPGLYPFGVGMLGVGLGIVIALRAVLAPDPGEGQVHLRPFLFVCAAIATFGMAIDRGGLLLAVVATTIVAALADATARPVETVLLGVGLAVGIWVLFVVLLGLPIPVVPGGR